MVVVTGYWLLVTDFKTTRKVIRADQAWILPLITPPPCFKNKPATFILYYGAVAQAPFQTRHNREWEFCFVQLSLYGLISPPNP
jgi:hypothetical protein